jgi:hypothetical protein
MLEMKPWWGWWRIDLLYVDLKKKLSTYMEAGKKVKLQYKLHTNPVITNLLLSCFQERTLYQKRNNAFLRGRELRNFRIKSQYNWDKKDLCQFFSST